MSDAFPHPSPDPQIFSNARHFDRASLLALASLAIAWVSEYLSEKWYYADNTEMGFSLYQLSGPLALAAVTFAAVLMGCLLLRRQDLLARATAIAFLGMALSSPLVWAFLHYTGGYGDNDPDGNAILSNQILAIEIIPAILGLLWLGWRQSPRRICAPILALAYGSLMILNNWYISPYYQFLDYQYDEEAAPETRVNVEDLYLSQPALMAKEIAALAPQTPGKPEYYSLLLGGTADQSVFHSEVTKVDAIFAARDGAGHSLHLVNDEKDAMAYPLANRANLEAGLVALAKVMGPEDTAFLYLTSHGCQKFLSLSFYRAGTNNLTPDDFAAILDRSKIGPAVIVIGACHSGTFIPALQSPDRLIITAARADRSSFGCSDGAEWTQFGQSFFDKALRKEPDPRKAFEIARKDVQVKEFWSWRRSSLPQMVVGEKIAARLDALALTQ